jgi:hypothetical protein
MVSFVMIMSFVLLRGLKYSRQMYNHMAMAEIEFNHGEVSWFLEEKKENITNIVTKKSILPILIIDPIWGQDGEVGW